MTDSRREDISDTLRVLVATDCHLGYMDKDEIRRHDSFQAFDEICAKAEERQVDFLLFGGDHFHENKPSRSTLVKAIEILRRDCLKCQPVQFQVVSDQTVNHDNSSVHKVFMNKHDADDDDAEEIVRRFNKSQPRVMELCKDRYHRASTNVVMHSHAEINSMIRILHSRL